MFFTKKILSLLLLSSVQSMEVCYDRNIWCSNSNIEKNVISRQAENNPNGDRHTMPLWNFPGNLQVDVAQQAGRASPINFNAKYENTRALSEGDYQESFIEPEAIPGGYRFCVRNSPNQYLVPVIGSVCTKNGEEFKTYYFVSDYFFKNDYQVIDNIRPPRTRTPIDSHVKLLISRNKPFKRIRYDLLGHFFDITDQSGEIIYVDILDIVNLEVLDEGVISVTDFVAEAISFNQNTLQNGNMSREEWNRGDRNAIHPFCIGPFLSERIQQTQRSQPVVEVMKHTRFGEKDLSCEQKALSLLENLKTKTNSKNTLEEFKTLIRDSSEEISHETIIKFCASALRHKYDPEIEARMLTWLSDLQDRLSPEEYIGVYTCLVRANTKEQKNYAKTLKSLLINHRGEISHETNAQGLVAIVSARLPTDKEDGEELRKLLNQGAISPETHCRILTAVVSAKLRTQKQDAETLRKFLNAKNNLPNHRTIQAWWVLLNARFKIDYEDFTTIQPLIRFAQNPSGFAFAIGSNIIVQNSQECQELIIFCNTYGVEQPLWFFQQEKAKLIQKETIERSINLKKERSRHNKKNQNILMLGAIERNDQATIHHAPAQETTKQKEFRDIRNNQPTEIDE